MKSNRPLLMRIIVAVILIGMLTFFTVKHGERKRAREAFSNIQGSWKCISLEMGKEYPELAKGYMLNFRGTKLERVFDGDTDIGKFEIDTTTVPAQVYLWIPLLGGENYHITVGIVDIKGSRMRICRAISKGAVAPKKFKSSPNCHSLAEFERVEESNAHIKLPK